MSRNIETSTATGAAAIAHTFSPAWGAEIQRITLHLSAAPTTSEDYTITIDSVTGSAYDTLIQSVDLSSGSTEDLVYEPDSPLMLAPGDTLSIAYANTDTVTYGSTIYYDANPG